MAKFETETCGTSKTTALKLDGTPIARFYAGRFDEALLAEITEKLNRAA